MEASLWLSQLRRKNSDRWNVNRKSRSDRRVRRLFESVPTVSDSVLLESCAGRSERDRWWDARGLREDPLSDQDPLSNRDPAISSDQDPLSNQDPVISSDQDPLSNRDPPRRPLSRGFGNTVRQSFLGRPSAPPPPPPQQQRRSPTASVEEEEEEEEQGQQGFPAPPPPVPVDALYKMQQWERYENPERGESRDSPPPPPLSPSGSETSRDEDAVTPPPDFSPSPPSFFQPVALRGGGGDGSGVLGTLPRPCRTPSVVRKTLGEDVPGVERNGWGDWVVNLCGVCQGYKSPTAELLKKRQPDEHGFVEDRHVVFTVTPQPHINCVVLGRASGESAREQTVTVRTDALFYLFYCLAGRGQDCPGATEHLYSRGTAVALQVGLRSHMGRAPLLTLTKYTYAQICLHAVDSTPGAKERPATQLELGDAGSAFVVLSRALTCAQRGGEGRERIIVHQNPLLALAWQHNVDLYYRPSETGRGWPWARLCAAVLRWFGLYEEKHALKTLARGAITARAPLSP